MKNYTKPKLIRVSTVAISLDILLKGQLSFLQDHFEVIAVSGFDAHLKNVENREGVRTVDISMQRSISPVRDLISFWRLYLLFKREKPHAVHSITPKAGLLSMAAAYFANVPIRIHTFTGLIFPSKLGLLRKILINMDKLLCFFATNIIPEGEGVKNDLKRFQITRKPLRIICNGNVNGIDLGHFRKDVFTKEELQKLKAKIGISRDDFCFIFVGRLVCDKGINELVQAFSKLIVKHPSVKLILVGQFENERDPLLPNTIELISVVPSIINVGFQTDVRPFLAIADVLVFPSYREGFPNVVLQAGAMTLPCIVTNINGCNEIIHEGINGTIIPPKDPLAILNAMRQMIDDEVWRARMQQRSREMISTRFDQNLVWKALLDEYKVIGSHV